MLSRIPKPTSPVWSSEPLLSKQPAWLLPPSRWLATLKPASVGTAELAATFPEINGKIAFQSWVDAGEGVENPTGDAEIFAIEPDGAGPIRRTHIGEPFE